MGPRSTFVCTSARKKPFSSRNIWWSSHRGRRVGLVGVLPLSSDSSPRRACYGLCFSLCSWAFYREIEPFCNPKDNSLVRGCHFHFFLNSMLQNLIDLSICKRVRFEPASQLAFSICFLNLLSRLTFSVLPAFPHHLDSALFLELRHPGRYLSYLWSSYCDFSRAG